MFLTYDRTNPAPLAELGNKTAGFSPYQGTAVGRPLSARFLRQVGRRYQQFPQQPVPMGPGLSAGNPPFVGQSFVRPPRATAGFIRQVARRYRQTAPEWAMLGQTLPSLPALLLAPTSVRPRTNGLQARAFRRPNLPADYVTVTGPGLTAGPPFAPTAYGPRFSGRDLLQRRRRYVQGDPRAALSGLAGRTTGSFVGAKLGHLTVQLTRSDTNMTIQPHRNANLTVQ